MTFPWKLKLPHASQVFLQQLANPHVIQAGWGWDEGETVDVCIHGQSLKGVQVKRESSWGGSWGSRHSHTPLTGTVLNFVWGGHFGKVLERKDREYREIAAGWAVWEWALRKWWQRAQIGAVLKPTPNARRWPLLSYLVRSASYSLVQNCWGFPRSL